MKNRNSAIYFLLIAIVVSFIYRNASISKTVGWAYDIQSVSGAITVVNAMLASLCYMCFYFLKARTNRIVSALHLLSLVLMVLLDFYYWMDVFLLLHLLPVIFLLANMVTAIRNPKRNIA